MTTRTKRPRSLNGAVSFLDRLAAEGVSFLFRGHDKASYRLATTLDRYGRIRTGLPGADSHDPTVDRMLRLYRDGVAKLSADRGLSEKASPLAWLEHARHHGLPAPLLDFSWSPYVALFFAFDGVGHPEKTGKSVVYALNVDELALHWVMRQTSDRGPVFTRLRDAFRYSSDSVTERAPNDVLAIVQRPSQFTSRMHRQVGAFLYSTLDYDAQGSKDLEAYLDEIDEEENRKESPVTFSVKHPVLTKVYLSHEWAGEAFRRLELMNITGASLFQSPDGVAKDARNTYHYHPKAAFVRADESPDPRARLHSLLNDEAGWMRPGELLPFYHRVESDFTIARGEVHDDNFNSAWTRRCADTHAVSYWVRAAYRGTVLEEYLLVLCDGGRMYVPVPDREGIQEVVQRTSPEWKVSRLFNRPLSPRIELASLGIQLR